MEDNNEQNEEVEYINVEEQDHFARAAQEDEDDEDDFDVPGPRVVVDMVLAKTLSMYSSANPEWTVQCFYSAVQRPIDP